MGIQIMCHKQSFVLRIRTMSHMGDMQSLLMFSMIQCHVTTCNMKESIVATINSHSPIYVKF